MSYSSVYAGTAGQCRVFIGLCGPMGSSVMVWVGDEHDRVLASSRWMPIGSGVPVAALTLEHLDSGATAVNALLDAELAIMGRCATVSAWDPSPGITPEQH